MQLDQELPTMTQTVRQLSDIRSESGSHSQQEWLKIPYWVLLENKYMLYNFAKDNRVSYSHTNMNNLQLRLKHFAAIEVDGFTTNEMETNPSI